MEQEQQSPRLWHYDLNVAINMIAGNLPAIGTWQLLLNASRRQLNIIRQEQDETRDDGIAANNHREIRDGIGDMIVTYDGLIHYLSSYVSHPGEVVHLEQVPTVVAVSQAMGDLDQLFDALTMTLDAEFCDSLAAHDTDAKNLLQTLLNRVYQNIAVLATYYAVPVAEDQIAIYESNLSKFDTTQAEAEASAQRYTDMGIDVVIVPTQYQGTDYFIVKSAQDQTVDGKKYAGGKFLKANKFFEPRLIDTEETQAMKAYLDALGEPANVSTESVPTEVCEHMAGLEGQLAEVKASAPVNAEDGVPTDRDYYELKIQLAGGESRVLSVALPPESYDSDAVINVLAGQFELMESTRLNQFVPPEKRVAAATVEAAIKQTLRLANLMAAIKAHRKSLSVTLDPDDPDPIGTLEKLISDLQAGEPLQFAKL
jgi:hypothetical protein